MLVRLGRYRAASWLAVSALIAAVECGAKSESASPAPPPPTGSTATLLFQETFENGALGSRGWYDLPAAGITSFSTAEHIPGSTRSLEFRFGQGQIVASPTASGRHKFTETDSLFFSYWVKYSDNWVGSGKPYHPHEFLFLTNLDVDYAGPASTFMTAYVEDNYGSGGAVAVLAIQDARNIDTTRIGQDLTALTEQRAVAGCNGGDNALTSCYRAGTSYFNGKEWRSASPVFTAAQGSGYKGSWHKVEVYFQLNSIQNGKGQPDGIARYWVDGRLVVDQSSVIFRTGAHPTMKFNQFLMAPYIGDGSPVAQSMWIDDMSLWTSRPPS
jgi:hypothetical protein